MNMPKRRLLLLLIDCVVFIGTYVFFTLFTKSYRALSELDIATKALHCGALLVCVFGVRLFMGIYGQVWRYANTTEYLWLVFADFLGGCLYLAVDRLLLKSHLMAAGAVSVICLSLVASLSARFAYQKLRYLQGLRTDGAKGNKINIAVVGAGMLGVSLVKELQSNPRARYKPCCFIDADEVKIGSRICGLKVYREGEDVMDQLQHMPVQEIVIAISSIKSEELHALYKRYEQTGCKVKIYAHPLEGVDAQETKWRIRDIRIEDLLFRDAITINDSSIQPLYIGKTILITGGGGSIGSELCRQVAKMRPARLVLVDIYENNAYDIQQEPYRTY